MVATIEAKVATELLKNQENLLKSVSTLRDELTAAIKRVDGNEEVLSKINVDEVLQEFESQKAWFEKARETMRHSRHGLYVSGAEELAYIPGRGQDPNKCFSLLRAMVAVKTGDWSRAGLEKDLLDQTREQFLGKAAQSVEVDSRGGFMVPEQVIPELIPAVYARSALINLTGDGETLVSVIDGLTTEAFKIPKFDGGVLAYWEDEEGAIAESLANVGDVDGRLKRLGVLVKLTDAMRRFGAMGFEMQVRRDMEIKMALKLDKAVLYGKGTDNQPRGVFNHPDVTQYSAETSAVLTSDPSDAQGGEMDFDDLDEMRGVNEDNDFEETPQSAFVSHPRFFRRIKRQKVQHYTGQTVDRAYILGAPRITDAALTELIGRFSKTTQVPTTNLPGESWQHPTTDTSPDDDLYGDVAYGNWNDVVVARSVALDIVDDDGKYQFPSSSFYLKLEGYFDVVFRRPESIVAAADVKMRD